MRDGGYEHRCILPRKAQGFSLFFSLYPISKMGNPVYTGYSIIDAARKALARGAEHDDACLDHNTDCEDRPVTPVTG